MVYYPYHPHCGSALEVVTRPRRAAASITVVDPAGAPLQVPAWMVSPEAGGFEVMAQATVAPQALLELCDLLRSQGRPDSPHG